MTNACNSLQQNMYICCGFVYLRCYKWLYGATSFMPIFIWYRRMIYSRAVQTLWRLARSCCSSSLLAYEQILLWNHTLSCTFCTTLHLHNSPVDCAGELFKPSKDTASLLACNEKNYKVWDFGFFVGDIISGVRLGFLVEVIRPWTSTTRGRYFAHIFSRN